MLKEQGGVALIAAHERAPILPVFIHGAYEAMPTGAHFIKPHKITITFAKPLRFPEEVYSRKDERDVIMQRLTDVMKSLESQAS